MKKIFIALIAVTMFVQIRGITLQEAVEISLKENVDYKEAQINKKISGINKNNSLLGMIPDFSTKVDYDVYDD